MVTGPGAFKVEGLAELRKALNDLGDVEDSTQLKAGLKNAAEIVANEARLRANFFSFTVADTIRSGTSGPKAFVRGGGKLAWYGWADFGSRTPRTGQPRSVGPWAHSGKGPDRGRFIYPAFDATESRVESAIADAINRARDAVGLHD